MGNAGHEFKKDDQAVVWAERCCKHDQALKLVITSQTRRCRSLSTERYPRSIIVRPRACLLSQQAVRLASSGSSLSSVFVFFSTVSISSITTVMYFQPALYICTCDGHPLSSRYFVGYSVDVPVYPNSHHSRAVIPHSTSHVYGPGRLVTLLNHVLRQLGMRGVGSLKDDSVSIGN
ncbi:hypothetical protein H4582DRAFT_1967381 [Lactarius indigo]|nr:hypothetical protein H4582DRAFT_1967381 [Lactarius indigo]